MVITTAGDIILASELPTDVQKLKSLSGTTVVGTLADAVEASERLAITAALDAAGLHREKTAKMLGISVRSLHYKMGRYGLH